MKEEYWHQRWQSNEIGFNQSQPNELLRRFFNVLNLKPGNRVFVPLCGKSVDMLWLASQGYEVVGVELTSIACEAFFNENIIPVNVTTTDNCTVFQSKRSPDAVKRNPGCSKLRKPGLRRRLHPGYARWLGLGYGRQSTGSSTIV